jgi:hypothetical protein
LGSQLGVDSGVETILGIDPAACFFSHPTHIEHKKDKKTIVDGIRMTFPF